jgi:hypothetical protein
MVAAARSDGSRVPIAGRWSTDWPSSPWSDWRPPPQYSSPLCFVRPDGLILVAGHGIPIRLGASGFAGWHDGPCSVVQIVILGQPTGGGRVRSFRHRLGRPGTGAHRGLELRAITGAAPTVEAGIDADHDRIAVAFRPGRETSQVLLGPFAALGARRAVGGARTRNIGGFVVPVGRQTRFPRVANAIGGAAGLAAASAAGLSGRPATKQRLGPNRVRARSPLSAAAATDGEPSESNQNHQGQSYLVHRLASC